MNQILGSVFASSTIIVLSSREKLLWVRQEGSSISCQHGEKGRMIAAPFDVGAELYLILPTTRSDLLIREIISPTNSDSFLKSFGGSF